VFVARRAQELGVFGTVRNLPDGRVEVVAQGAVEALDSLRELVATGPRMARVQNVENADISDETTRFKSFNIM
jgi:acylphosphatase